MNNQLNSLFNLLTNAARSTDLIIRCNDHIKKANLNRIECSEVETMRQQHTILLCEKLKEIMELSATVAGCDIETIEVSHT